MTGTIAYLSKYPEIAARIRAAVHLDMVGADPFITKSVLHVTRSPWSIATVTDDVEETFGRYVIDGAMRAAGEGDMTRAIRARGGSKDAFWADITPYESGSDHWIYQEGGFAIPSIYLRDHPDIYIHTTGDLPDNIEPTKIKRSAFLAAASGYYLATMPDHGAALLRLTYANAHQRLAEDGRRASAMASDGARAADAINIVNQGVLREQRRLRSLARFNLDADQHVGADHLDRLSAALADAAKGLLLTLPPAGPRAAVDGRIPLRHPGVKGPLTPGGDWLREKAGSGSVSIALAQVPNSDDVTYEIRTSSTARARSATSVTPSARSSSHWTSRRSRRSLDLLARAGAITFKR